jgi:PIN domain nuclease of toxin-antitoxin system
MTGEQSRQLSVGDRVCWGAATIDRGTVAEKNWAGITVKWDNRSKQEILHNDMGQVGLVPFEK